MKLYTFFRSSASYRVRIALNLKNLNYEQIPIHLRRGDQLASSYKAINPQGLVPALEHDGHLLTQSLAMIEYLEERYPEPPLLPRDSADRATVRSLALSVACEVHPIQNLRVINFLRKELGQSEETANRWAQYWINLGLEALERSIVSLPRRKGFCFGETPTLADICLVPQLANARRFRCDLTQYPTLAQVEAHCLKLPAFANAAPENQPDAE